MTSGPVSSKAPIYAALIGNLLVAITKFIAAGWTGSSSMLSEGIHSLVDTGNEVLLLYGIRRAGNPPDREHPLGYGRELYFWSFIVALLIFAVGAGVSLYEGVMHILAPEPIADPHVSYIVLGLSFLFEGVSWWVSFRSFRRLKGDMGYLEAVRKSKDPPSFMVLLEDTAALLGLVIAFAGVFLSVQLGDTRIDGLASIGIGLLLAVVAAVLARESKNLLIGERADARLSQSILAIADAEPGVTHANGVITSHLAPDQVVAALSVDFDDQLLAGDIETAVSNIEDRVRQAHPEISALFVKPQSTEQYQQAKMKRYKA
ncbi:cation diffusion facilitator family transporter [Pedomonas mirosovicensis]|uniref:cation diffusion facilitator family transporter n=1 Tax=Pedomonas mirosovicensis TaxID=2908641 RepID=UPI0021682372|nr:cation diffusion facilitator family transporter [Pedomonas mirosovicensis]MCH8683862.1 cation diffusion facilitator family transporter [Pedomonas mirosovicensis]